MNFLKFPLITIIFFAKWGLHRHLCGCNLRRKKILDSNHITQQKLSVPHRLCIQTLNLFFDNWYKFILNLFNFLENKLVKIPIFHNYFFLQSSVQTEEIENIFLILHRSAKQSELLLMYTNLKPFFDSWYKFIFNLFNFFENKLVKIPIFHNYFSCKVVFTQALVWQ